MISAAAFPQINAMLHKVPRIVLTTADLSALMVASSKRQLHLIHRQTLLVPAQHGVAAADKHENLPPQSCTLPLCLECVLSGRAPTSVRNVFTSVRVLFAKLEKLLWCFHLRVPYACALL